MEQFCEIIFNLDQWLWRKWFKRFLIWSSGDPVGIIGNIYVKLFGPVVQEMLFKEKVYGSPRTQDGQRPIGSERQIRSGEIKRAITQSKFCR